LAPSRLHHGWTDLVLPLIHSLLDPQQASHIAPTKTWRFHMPVESHKKAADHHDVAAKSHRAAADTHGKDDHKAAHGQSEKAHEATTKAQESSKQAHGKSESKNKAK
jgi:hypothetical protein